MNSNIIPIVVCIVSSMMIGVAIGKHMERSHTSPPPESALTQRLPVPPYDITCNPRPAP